MQNVVALVGRLTRDVELRYTANGGVAVATITLAVDRPFKNQQGERETDFIRTVIWRKQAENCANYIGKGSKVAIEGRLQVRSYEDGEGNRRTIAEVVANNVTFLDSKKEREQQQEVSEEDNPIAGEEAEDEDMPF